MELKYFDNEEIAGLLVDVGYKLDRAREYYGKPIIITSGYRDPLKNKEVGGVFDSAHTTGKAVDLKVTESTDKERLLWALCAAGFKRVGYYDKHIHVDIDDSKPMPAFWKGKSK